MNKVKEKLQEYEDFLYNKGRIIRIKDTNLKLKIITSPRIFLHFLTVISFLLICLSIFLMFYNFNSEYDQYDWYKEYAVYDEVQNNIVRAGVAMFTIIVICVTVDLKKKSGFTISFPSEKTIKINHKIYDLEKDDCSIDIYSMIARLNTNGDFHREFDEPFRKYFISLKTNKHCREYEIFIDKNQNLEKLIYNLDYEYSEQSIKRHELLKKFNDVLEKKITGTQDHYTSRDGSFWQI